MIRVGSLEWIHQDFERRISLDTDEWWRLWSVKEDYTQSELESDTSDAHSNDRHLFSGRLNQT